MSPAFLALAEQRLIVKLDQAGKTTVFQNSFKLAGAV
jgi:hypothetical protein